MKTNKTEILTKTEEKEKNIIEEKKEIYGIKEETTKKLIVYAGKVIKTDAQTNLKKEKCFKHMNKFDRQYGGIKVKALPSNKETENEEKEIIVPHRRMQSSKNITKYTTPPTPKAQMGTANTKIMGTTSEKTTNTASKRKNCTIEERVSEEYGVALNYAIGIRNPGASCYIITAMNMLRSIGGIRIFENVQESDKIMARYVKGILSTNNSIEATLAVKGIVAIGVWREIVLRCQNDINEFFMGLLDGII